MFGCASKWETAVWRFMVGKYVVCLCAGDWYLRILGGFGVLARDASKSCRFFIDDGPESQAFPMGLRLKLFHRQLFHPQTIKSQSQAFSLTRGLRVMLFHQQCASDPIFCIGNGPQVAQNQAFSSTRGLIIKILHRQWVSDSSFCIENWHQTQSISSTRGLISKLPH